MNLIWNNEAWEEYVQWQKQDKKIVKKINEIIKDIKQTSLKLRENLNLSGLFFCLFEIYETKFINIIVQSHFQKNST